MKMTSIEQNILSTLHDLPFEKQQVILNFSLFLKSNIQKSELKNHSNFSIALHEFLNQSKAEPLEIDAAMFDSDRE